ncbi:MAG: ATP-binding cassette domain-containing protein [Rhizobiaceae bacterium]|nr:ATP-binding cassette domain-containing protein [Rhizobiaceae bacterium]
MRVVVKKSHSSVTEAEAAIVAEDIHKTLGNHPVLRGVNLLARSQDVISILGSSGSGKSTFLRCLNLLEVPDRGAVWFRGEKLDIRNSTGSGRGRIGDAGQAQRVRASLGMVFQNFNLWPHRTVVENVMVGPKHVLGLSHKAALERAELYLRKVAMFDRRDARPDHLSGGQRQRVAIARALAMEPDVLLFDEPTSALDPELIGEVLRVIRMLAAEGRTMIIVTHELNFARDVSNRTLFMHGGRIEEEGRTADLFAHPQSERLSRFLGTRSDRRGR